MEGLLPRSSSTSRDLSGDVDRPVLLALSHLRWDFVFQRPQHLLTRAALTHDVIFWEEPVRAAIPAPRLQLTERPGPVTVAVPLLPDSLDAAAAEAAQRRLLQALLTSRRAAQHGLIAWFYTPMALGFAGGLRADVTIYDCMDELSAFRGAPPQMLLRESELLATADIVFTGGRSLHAAKQGRHPRVHCFPSSIDAPHFRQARGGLPDPAEQAGIPHPRLGFFGVIDERMDLDLVAGIAAARPEWQLVMLGPVVKIDPAALPNAANIHWFGGRKYAELPSYLAGWNVGIMPFARNESTRFISPTKTPEFLAAGLPVVSTAIADVVRDWGEAGLVEIADDAAGFVDAVELLLARPRAPWLRRVDTHLSAQSWDATWAAMAGLIEACVGAEPLRSVEHV